MSWLLLSILLLPVAYGTVVALRRWVRSLLVATRRDWRQVPPPNWACSRRRTGGLYW